MARLDRLTAAAESNPEWKVLLRRSFSIPDYLVDDSTALRALTRRVVGELKGSQIHEVHQSAAAANLLAAVIELGSRGELQRAFLPNELSETHLDDEEPEPEPESVLVFHSGVSSGTLESAQAVRAAAQLILRRLQVFVRKNPEIIRNSTGLQPNND